VRTFIDNSGLLVLGTALALVWANVSAVSYDTFAHSLHFIVNDIGMAFFFALAAKEVVEATAPGGALHSVRRAAVPLIAAIGGMAGPASSTSDGRDVDRPTPGGRFRAPPSHSATSLRE
jgi:NhaA family Na+:H+ antiporter